MKTKKNFLILGLLAFSFSGCLFPARKSNLWLFIPLALTGNGSVGAPPKYSVGGSITGIEEGKYLTLKNSTALGESEINILTNGPFTFNSDYSLGAEYNVSIKKDPAGQTCVLENGKGVINSTNVVDLKITCANSIRPPTHQCISVSFNDVDSTIGKIGGVITIEKALDESNITTYSLYWSNSVGIKQSSNPITILQKSGNNLLFTLPRGTIIPNGATHFLSITGNSAGEMTSGITSIIRDYTDSAVPVTGNLSVSNVTSSSLVLNWERSTDNETAQSNLQYRVYRSSLNNLDTVTNTETNGTALNEFTTDLTTYTVTGLTANTLYYFNVVVKDELGNKSIYVILQGSTLNNNSPVPGNSGIITSSGVTTNSLNLSWTSGTDNTTSIGNLEYIVYSSTANNINTVTNAEANGTALNAFTAGLTAYNAVSLQSAATYYFTVIIKDADGFKSIYQTITVQTLDGNAPAPGANGIITSNNLTTSGLNLQWDRSTDNGTSQSNLQYRVYRSSLNNLDTITNTETNGTALNEFTTDLTTYTVTGLTANTLYYFNVIVKDETGNKSIYVMLQSSTLNNNAPVPGNSGLITSSGVTTNSVNLGWTAGTDNITSEGALEYIVYRSNANNINTVANAEANGTALNAYTAGLTAYNAVSLQSAATYYFTVIIKDADGFKSVYQTVTVQTLDANAPVPGAGGAITAGSITGTTLTLNWTKANDDITLQSNLQYIVYRSANNNINTVANAEANGTPLNSYTSDINSFNVSGLSNFTAYFFNVIVKDETGNKAIYSSGSFTTLDALPPVPGNGGTITTPSIPTDSSIVINWTKAADTATVQASLQYIVYYSTSSNIATVVNAEANGTAANAYTSDINTLTVNGLLSGTQYYFNVIVKDTAGNKASYTPTYFTTEISSWKFVDGDQTESGINRDSSLNVDGVKLKAFNSKLYHCMSEGGKIHVTVFNENESNPLWTNVDNGTINKNSSRNAHGCNLEIFNSKLYAVWYEQNSSSVYQVRVAVYNGNDLVPVWSFVDGNDAEKGLNKIHTRDAYNYSGGPSFVPRGLANITVHKSKLYIAWVETVNIGANTHNYHVIEYNSNDLSPAWSFVDGAQGYIQTTSINFMIGDLKSINGTLYINFIEDNDGSGTNYFFFKVFKYMEFPNINWQSTHQTAAINTNYSEVYPGPLLELNAKPYVFYVEKQGSGILQTKVRSFDGVDTWNIASSQGHLNKNASRNSITSDAIVFNSKIYAATRELNQSNVLQIRIQRFNGIDTWNFLDGNGEIGLNKNISKDANSPKFEIFNGRLYVTWYEKNSSDINQARVARGK